MPRRGEKNAKETFCSVCGSDGVSRHSLWLCVIVCAYDFGFVPSVFFIAGMIACRDNR